MNVLDTTLRISIGDYFYKITEWGTFKSDIKNKTQVENLIDSFYVYKNKFSKINESEYVFENIVFCPKVTSKDSTDLIEDCGSSLRSSVSSSDMATLKINKKNLWKVGFCHVKTNKFSNNRRMELRFHSTNFLFYTSSGIKITMEKKKKILGISYWKSISSTENRVLGFNNFEFEYKLAQPVPPMSELDPYPANYKDASAKIGGVTVNLILDQAVRIPFISDISKCPAWVVDNGYLTQNEASKIWDASFKEAMKVIRSKGKSMLSNTIYKTQNDPLQTLQEQNWDGSKIKQSLVGEIEFGAGGTKTITFHRAFGITISYNTSVGVKPFLPTKITFGDVDFYAAVKYGGKWKGIRFYSE